jgi:AcrR family transcriptional regulator
LFSVCDNVGVTLHSGRRLQDRSVATRQALLDAALECLVDCGYSGTTTIETARRAGVSRGAQLHHFPTKAALLTAAVEHLLERRVAEFRRAFAGSEPGGFDVGSVIDLLWSMFEGPTFVAWTELWVGARTDPELAAAVVDMDRRFSVASAGLYCELFPAESRASDSARPFGQDFAFALMEGLALVRMVPHSHSRPAAEYLDALKSIARSATPATQQP